MLDAQIPHIITFIAWSLNSIHMHFRYKRKTFCHYLTFSPKYITITFMEYMSWKYICN